jgi:hypothetical protein
MPRSHVGGVEVWLYSFSTNVQDGGKWSTSCSGHFILGKRKEDFLVLARKLIGTRTKGIDIRLCVLCMMCVCLHAVFDVALLHLALKLALYVLV